jgi:TonB family protein
MPGFFRDALLPIVLLTRMAVPCTAQQTIGGILINERSHHPIGNAKLSLVDDSDRVVARTVSDSVGGEFYLDAPKPGRYAVSILVGRGALTRSPEFQLDSGQVIQRTFAVPDFPQSVLDAYLPDDVTKRAAILPDDWRLHLPRYPDELRSRDRSGVVRTTFVVDRDGRADMNTFRVLESSDPQFAAAVRVMAERFRYSPAERDGAPVSQVFDQTVYFVCDDGAQHAPADKSDKHAIVITAFGCHRY